MLPLRATHWISETDPELAQAIASIVLNFGTYESEMSRLLADLQDCPPNERTALKSSLSDKLNALDTAVALAFKGQALEKRIAGMVKWGRSINDRRNIVIHSYLVQTTQGGLVLYREQKNARTIYDVTTADLVALDNEITLANLDLQHFVFGVADPSRDDETLLIALRSRMVHRGPRPRPELQKVRFPQS